MKKGERIMKNQKGVDIQGSIFAGNGDVFPSEFLEMFKKFIRQQGWQFEGNAIAIEENGDFVKEYAAYHGKYIKLYDYLLQKRRCYSVLTLSFQELENILQFQLPKSAYKYGAWWSNESSGTHSHAYSWLNSGWKTSRIILGESVDFIRNESDPE
jgi:hypothetical protein